MFFKILIVIPTLRLAMKSTDSDENCKEKNMDEVLVHIKLLYTNFKSLDEAKAQVVKEVIKYNIKLKKRLLSR